MNIDRLEGFQGGFAISALIGIYSRSRGISLALVALAIAIAAIKYIAIWRRTKRGEQVK